MKTVTPYLIFFFTLLLACDDEVNNGLEAYRVDLVEVNSSNTYSLLDKKGTTLYNAGKNIQGQEIGKRILLNYSYLNQQQPGYDYVIKINGVGWVYCDSIRMHPVSTGNDPIMFESAWVGQHYLNMGFYIDQHSVSHQIVLTPYTSPLEPKDHHVYLELRHDKKNDPPGTRKKIHASFDLNVLGLVTGQDTVILKITNNYLSEEFYILPY